MTKRKVRADWIGKPEPVRPCRFKTKLTRYSKKSNFILWLDCGNQSFRIVDDDDEAYAKFMERQLKIAIRHNNAYMRSKK